MPVILNWLFFIILTAAPKTSPSYHNNEHQRFNAFYSKIAAIPNIKMFNVVNALIIISFKYLTRLVFQLMEHYYIFKKRRVSTKQSSVKPMGSVCSLKEKNITAGAVENGSANQAAGSGIVEPPDTARRDREGFLIKGIVNSSFFCF